MWHIICRQINRVDSRLFLLGSQIGNLTFGPSFGHNLCFRCLNEQCEPILDIYVSRAFQWYKECHNPLSFDRLKSLSEISRIHWDSLFQSGSCFGNVSVHSLTLPHTSLHSQEYVMWLPGFLLARTLVLPWFPSFLPFGLQPCNPFCLGRKPKARVATPSFLSSWYFHTTS